MSGHDETQLESSNHEFTDSPISQIFNRRVENLLFQLKQTPIRKLAIPSVFKQEVEQFENLNQIEHISIVILDVVKRNRSNMAILDP